MNRSNLTIIFYLKPSFAGAEVAPIYVRITIDGIRKAFSVNRQVTVTDWDSQKQRAKIKSPLAFVVNNQLDSVRQLLFENHRVLSDQNLYVTTQMLFDKINEKEEKKLTFVDFYKQFLENKKLLVGTEITQEIASKHQRIFKKFLAFLETRKLNDIDFADLDNDFGKNFFLYLKTVCSLSHNTAVKQMQLFKCVIKDAVRKGHLANDPFYEVKLVVKDKPRDYLVEEEIDAIAALSDLMPRIELVRDIFLFSCYTGLAYIDVKQLTDKNISTGVNNKLWLFTQRQKTEVQSNIVYSA